MEQNLQAPQPDPPGRLQSRVSAPQDLLPSVVPPIEEHRRCAAQGGDLFEEVVQLEGDGGEWHRH